MRVNQIYDQRAHCDLVCFGEAVTRDPFMLVGRTPRPNFRLAVLTSMHDNSVGETITGSSGAPTNTLATYFYNMKD